MAIPGVPASSLSASSATRSARAMASILLSLSAALAPAPANGSRRRSFSASMPEASRTRRARVSVGLPGIPLASVLPLRSETRVMPWPLSVTRCKTEEPTAASVRSGAAGPLNLPAPWSASYASSDVNSATSSCALVRSLTTSTAVAAVAILPTLENIERENRGDEEVGDVDQVADPKVHRHARQYICLLGGEPCRSGRSGTRQQVDHVQQRIPGRQRHVLGDVGEGGQRA